jgi:archaellum biogenesis ATPase FlaH
MLDSSLLAAAIASKRAYDAVKHHVSDTDFTPPVAFWWKLVAEWYENDPVAASVDKAQLAARGDLRTPNPKHKTQLAAVLSDLPASASPDNAALLALELKRHNVGMELASAIASSNTESVSSLLPVYHQLMQSSQLSALSRRRLEEAPDWSDLDATVGREHRVPLAPRPLNERTDGGALPGHHICVFGRPDIGKSAFVLNMVAGFLYTRQRVLYVGNEDNIAVLKARLRSRLSGMTMEEAEAQPEEAARRARAKSNDNIFMYHMHRGTIEDIYPLADSHEPTVIVLDQIRSVAERADGMTQKLERAGIAFRQLLSTTHTIGVSVTQAYAGEHDSGGKVWLDMDDVDSSRTGLPGTVDLLIGLGADIAMQQRNQIAVSLSKNKLSSSPIAKQGFIVEIDKSRAFVS